MAILEGGPLTRPTAAARRVAPLVAALAVMLLAISVPGTEASAGPAPAKMVRLAGQITSVERAAVALADAPVPGTVPVTVTITLRRSRQQAFERFLAAVTDPHSVRYRHFLTQRALADRYGPTLDAYDRVRDWLSDRHLRVIAGSSNRLTLTATGSARAVESTFAVTLRDGDLDGRRVRVSTTPAVPAGIAPLIQAVDGLSSLDRPQVGGLAQSFPTNTPVLQPTDVPGFDPNGTLAFTCWLTTQFPDIGPYAGDAIPPLQPYGDFSTALSYQCIYDEMNLYMAYVGSALHSHHASLRALGAHATAASSGLPGTGERIGLLEFDTFHPVNVSDLLTLTGSPASMTNLSETPVDGGVATPGAGEDEVLLDIDAAMQTAPGAKVVVYDAPPSASFASVFNAMIADGDTVISNSWSSCESDVAQAQAQAIDSVLQSAEAAGITVLNGSGDSGSTCLGGSANTVGVPADSPSATAVGGTSSSPGIGGSYDLNSWWGSDPTAADGGAGGFGVSQYFSRPSYQAPDTSASGRSVPDIAINADPASNGLEICQADAGGCRNGLLYGGTSVAAPLMAGAVADLDAYLGSPVGALNPLLYPLAGSDALHSAATMSSDFAHVGLGTPDLGQVALDVEHATPGPVSATLSSLSAEPLETVPADGSTPDSLVATVADASGDTIAGRAVSLSAGAHTGTVHITQNSATSDGDGAVEFQVTDTVAEQVTFTATDTTDGVALGSPVTVDFVAPQATGASITADPTDVADNGSADTTVSVYLENALGEPAPGKTVTLSDGGTHATITAVDGGVTDSSGVAQFTATDATDESVAFTATDVTDGDLAVPGSAVVTFEPSGSAGCSDAEPTMTDGYGIAPWATGFQYNQQALVYGNFTQTPCAGAGEIAFDGSGNAYISDVTSGQIYRFGVGGGAVNASTTLPDTGFGPGFSLGGVQFAPDGDLYAADTGNGGSTLALEQLDPTNGTDLRTALSAAAGMPACAFDLAADPVSGDLFSPFGCTGTNEATGLITEIADPASASASASTYPGEAGTNTYEQPGTDTLTFAPNGTIYGAFNDGTIESISGTNGPNPAVVTKLTTLTNPAAGIAIAATNASGAATALYVDDDKGNVDLVTLGAAPQITTIGSGGGSDLGQMAIGGDGCLYISDLDEVLRVTTPGCSAANEPELSLAQTSGSAMTPTGSAVTVTATLTGDASPAGTPIHFLVSGANPATKLVDAGDAGGASFTYDGVQQGVDTVTAVAVVNGHAISSAPLAVHWTAGLETSFLSLNQSQQAGQAGQAATLTADLVDVTPSTPTPISGAPITLSLAGQTCGATTDSSGVASCQVTPTGATGIEQTVAAYAGSTRYAPSTASNAFDLGPVGLGQTTTSTTTSTTSPAPPATTGSAPVNTVAPSISGTPEPGHRLTCSTGSWSNAPTSFSDQWELAGKAIPGADGAAFTVQISDEALALSCVVTATNRYGATLKTSAGVIVAIPGTLSCAKPTGTLRGVAVGPLSLGMTRAQARHKLKTFGVARANFQGFCLYAGWGIRVGFPSASLLKSVTATARSKLRNRIILELTANQHYALDGVKAGVTLGAVRKRIGQRTLGSPVKVGSNDWYLIRGTNADGVLQVQKGEVIEIGLADASLLRTSTAQRRFLTSFDDATS